MPLITRLFIEHCPGGVLHSEEQSNFLIESIARLKQAGQVVLDQPDLLLSGLACVHDAAGRYVCGFLPVLDDPRSSLAIFLRDSVPHGGRRTTPLRCGRCSLKGVVPS